MERYEDRELSFGEYIDERSKKRKYGLISIIHDTVSHIMKRHKFIVFLVPLIMTVINAIYLELSGGLWNYITKQDEYIEVIKRGLFDFSQTGTEIALIFIGAASGLIGIVFLVNFFKSMYIKKIEPKSYIKDGLIGILRMLAISILSSLVFVLIGAILSFLFNPIALLMYFVLIMIVTVVTMAVVQDVKMPLFEAVGHGFSVALKNPQIILRNIVLAIIIALVSFLFNNLVVLTVGKGQILHTFTFLIANYVELVTGFIFSGAIAVNYRYYDDYRPSYAPTNKGVLNNDNSGIINTVDDENEEYKDEVEEIIEEEDFYRESQEKIEDEIEDDGIGPHIG